MKQVFCSELIEYFWSLVSEIVFESFESCWETGFDFDRFFYAFFASLSFLEISSC